MQLVEGLQAMSHFWSCDLFIVVCIVAACSGSLDLVFMLDQSGSVGFANHKTALKFVHDVSSFYNISTNETQV